MTIDLSAAADFMATHARLLDRRRFELLHGDADPFGWVVDFHSASPRGALDWRGYATVRALDVLRRNDALKIESRAHP